MNGALIMVGFEETSSWTFEPVRGFVLSDEGIEETRQYVNLLVEARPYEPIPLVKVYSLGLMGDVPEKYSRDKAVPFDDLFGPATTPEDADAALAVLRAKLTGEAPAEAPESLECAALSDECFGPVKRREGQGNAPLCGGHAVA